MEDEIVAWRKRLADDGLDAGARTISWHMSRNGVHVPSLAIVHRVLRRRGFVWIRFESSLPSETWQSDMTQ